MRQVALERFGLQLMNDHLPAESFDAAVGGC